MATKKTSSKSAKASAKKPAAAKTTAAKTTTKTSKPAARKAAPKPTVKPETVETKPHSSTPATSGATKSVTFRKSYVALIIIILLIGAGLYYFRGLFVAAVVNGQPVSRLEIVRQAEQQVGKQTLDTLVRNTLIEQKAKEQNITVTEDEINQEIKKLQDNLKAQGQDLNQVLQAQGMSQDDLKRLIRLDKLVAKMVGKDVEVSDEEVAKYIEDNRDAYPEDMKEDELKKQVQEQLKQQKTNEKVRDWLTKIQQEANVIYFVQY